MGAWICKTSTQSQFQPREKGLPPNKQPRLLFCRIQSAQHAALILNLVRLEPVPKLRCPELSNLVRNRTSGRLQKTAIQSQHQLALRALTAIGSRASYVFLVVSSTRYEKWTPTPDIH